MPSGTNSFRVTKQSHVIIAQSAEIRQSIQYFGALTLQFPGNILRKAIIIENANKPSKDAELYNLKQIKNHRPIHT